MHEITIHSVEPKALFTEPSYATVDTILNTRITQWYYFLKESLPKGFQARIIIKTNNHVEYDKGIKVGESGSFAKVKIATLERFPHLSLTGDHDMATLIQMIHTVDPNYDVSGFSHLENPGQLTREQHEDLRDLGITAFLGGIGIPFNRYSSIPNCGVNTESGEILISFSALTGEQDLMMCFIILGELQKALQEADPHEVYVLDFSKLNESPIARFHMRMHGIKPITE